MNINEVVQRLEQCAAASFRWADGNAARFEASNIEAVLFSGRRKHWQERGEKTVRVDDQTVRFLG